MVYTLNGKQIRIPDAEIQKSMKSLDLTQDEAIQMWLEDEGYLENDEQEALCQKAKDSRITATIHQAKAETSRKTQKERVRKDDPTKEKIISDIAEFLADCGAENVQIVNKGKLITFTIGEDSFKFDLIRQRKPKK